MGTGETGQGGKQSGDLLDAVEEDMKLADVREEGMEGWMEVEDADGLYIDLFHDIGSTSCRSCTDTHTHTHKNSTSKTRNEKNKIKYISAINPLAVHSSMCFDCLQGIVVIGSQQRECSIITSLLGNLFLVQQRIQFCFGSCFFLACLLFVTPAEYTSFFPHVLAFFML